MPAEDWIICRCEEVKLSEILEAIRQGARDVDAVKRMTRAGMGLCQGRTCARLVSRIIAGELGVPAALVRQARQRLPVRPTPASLFTGTEGTRT
jgi:NAD(P)H-nitrite reductase large subunit